MLFPTTIAGSLPKPEWLAEPNTLWAPWKSKGDELGARQARRHPAGDQAAGGRRHRHRHRGRAGPPAFRPRLSRRRSRASISPTRSRWESAKTATRRWCRRWWRRCSLKGRVHADEARVARTHTTRKLKFTLPGPMTIIDTIADQYYGDRVKMAFAFAELLNAGSQGPAGRRRRRDPVRRARLQRLHGRGLGLGHQGAGARRRGADLRHRGAHLLRLRHQGQYRLEADARQRVAAVRGYLSGDRRKPDPAGRDRMPQFAGAAGTAWRCSRARSSRPA